MKLRKSPDNNYYEARLDSRRISVNRMSDGGIRVSINRVIPKESQNKEPFRVMSSKSGKETVIETRLSETRVSKRKATLVFDLSDEAVEALAALLYNVCKDDGRI